MKDYRKEKEYIELKEKRDAARKLYNDLDYALENYAIDKLEQEYGKDFCCDKCRYYAFYDFSGDGWHNECAYPSAPCTCCNTFCQHYRPDTEITKWIKENYEQLPIEEFHAFTQFLLEPFVEERTTPEKMELMKALISQKHKIKRK